MSEFFTGYNPELERRDEIANSSTPMMFTMRDFQAPEEIDPRGMIRHDDQGNMGSCGGHGNTNAAEYVWALSDGKCSDAKQLSRLFAYLEAQRFDGLLGRDAGSTISGGLRVAKEVGYLEEKHLKYFTPYPGNARTLITNEMRQLAEPFKIRSHTWLESYDGIYQYIASGAGACFVGTLWNNSFYASGGVLESISLRNGGGHAYCFAGYSKRKDSRGRNYIWRKNSHSNDNWTEIAPGVIDALCKHSYTSIVGISDLSTPGPRQVDWLKERPLG